MILTQKINDTNKDKKLLFLFAVNAGLGFDSNSFLINILDSIICVKINGKLITVL